LLLKNRLYDGGKLAASFNRGPSPNQNGIVGGECCGWQNTAQAITIARFSKP